MKDAGDQAFRKEDPMGRWPEMTYGGVLSFLRRKYSRDLSNVDVAIMGVPFDNAVTHRSGCRPLGVRPMRRLLGVCLTHRIYIDTPPYRYRNGTMAL